MKTKAMLLASVLLVGCQASKHDVTIQQHAQSLSTTGQGEAEKYTGQATSMRWLNSETSLAQDQNLWHFISDELKMGIPENDRIREQKQKYLRNKSYLHDVTLRAEPYMYWISRQVQKRNMPMELVLLPIVESAFDPHATSAANAAGIWQIMPGTGRNYGLKQTQTYDARRDLVASTTAALDMMQRLNKMFNGDWLLTVAAYNSGEGRVMNAMKANRTSGKPTDFWSLSLPRETKIYVPKMLALSDILKNRRRYGLRLPTPDESRALARVELNNPIELAQVAEMTGMPLARVKAFNAGVKSSTIGKSSPQYVMVPKKHAETLRSSLASGKIVAAEPTLVANNRSSSAASGSKFYKVRSGDTLSGIASRTGMSTKELQSRNNLRGAHIKTGQMLSVGNDGTRLAKSDSITYKVRKGDSLSSIAKRHGVGIKDVIRWNSDTDNLRPGDQLTLFVRNDTTPET